MDVPRATAKESLEAFSIAFSNKEEQPKIHMGWKCTSCYSVYGFVKFSRFNSVKNPSKRRGFMCTIYSLVLFRRQYWFCVLVQVTDFVARERKSLHPRIARFCAIC